MRARIVALPVTCVALATLLSSCDSKASAPTPSPTVGPTASAGASAATDNGVSALTADEILTRTKAAVLGMRSFHAKGDQMDGEVKNSADVVITPTGGKGSIVIGGVAIEVVKIGTDIYIKAPAEYWRNSPPASLQKVTSLAKDKYVKISTILPTASSYANSLRPDFLLNPHGAVTKGSAATVNGRPAITIVDETGVIIYVATTGAPVPLRVESKPGVFLDVIDIDARVEIAPPPAAQVFDASPLLTN